MGLSSDVVCMVEAIALNDLPKARAYARVIVENDAAASRNIWRIRMARALDYGQAGGDVAIPDNIKGMLYVETPDSFHMGRYRIGLREHAVMRHVTDMRRASEKLAMMGIDYKNATMLAGESGVGKTMLARAVACKMHLPLLYVNFSRLINSYMGATSGNIARIFSFAATLPCVLMLDEVDTIAVSRMSAHDGPSTELSRVTITLMQEIDHMPTTTVLLAATNRPDMLDSALVRRFSAMYEITRPQDARTVTDIIERFLGDVGLRCDAAELGSVVGSARSTYPTQSAIVTGLVESIAAHVMDGRGADDPVPMGWLGELVAKANGQKGGEADAD